MVICHYDAAIQEDGSARPNPLAATGQALRAMGQLTVRGRTHPVTIEGTMTLAPNRQRLEVEACIEADRAALGMDSGLLGMVGKRIQGRAHLVFDHIESSSVERGGG